MISETSKERRGKHLPLHILILCLLNDGTHSQTTCSQPVSTEWHLQPQSMRITWTLAERICRSAAECWGMPWEAEGEGLYPFPQMCPLQLQLRDRLLLSPDSTLQSYRIQLVNVSEEDFKNCNAPSFSQNPLLLGVNMNQTVEVDQNWLSAGTHYFTSFHQGSSQLCRVGLRLNVTVKEQLCQRAPPEPLCSGHGVCRSRLWEDVYSCQCNKYYSGQFCEQFDACSENPCANGAVCVRKTSSSQNHSPYECLCPSQFTGVSCSEIIGNCDKRCVNGRCHQVTPNSFQCVCDPGYTGTEDSASDKCRSLGLGSRTPACSPSEWFLDFSEAVHSLITWKLAAASASAGLLGHSLGIFCQEKVTYCGSNPCKNGAVCKDGVNGYVCTCPEGFTGLNCDTELRGNCTSHGCEQEQPCVTEENNYMCACADGSAGVQCGERLGPCSSGPCFNNGSCLSQGEDYYCRCLRGFTGKNCEEIIDYCRLLSIRCLNEGLCLNIIGGYNCLCAPGWTGETCQHVENACLIYPDSCLHGATCIDTSQPGAPPRYTCACRHGYTGDHCETEVNECASNPCRHNGTCTDLIGSHRCTCPVGFLGENCEVDVDACALPNATCPMGLWCLDLPDGLEYTCHLPCPPHTQPCANGGRCFLNNTDTYSCVCAPGWTGHTCLENIDDCVEHWCQNGATCVDDIAGYRCLCPHGFTGAYCELVIDYCIGNLCSNHGACLNQRYNYTCRCMLGYEGRYCELKIDECRSSPCAKGATCLDVIGGYLCHCPPGFEGRTCAENVNDCWSKPCLNGGTCVDLINNYTCLCPFGFGGGDCSTAAIRCASNPCHPEGSLSCEELANGFKCVCQHGRTGRFCETPISHCEDGLCQHGSKCMDLSEGFQCVCLPGFTGEFCEVDIDDCQSNPCGALSICKDTLNGYNCFCAPGFIGVDCQIEVDECLSQPCQNGGSCYDELNNFRCICPDGIAGDSCEINIDECLSSPCLHDATCLDLVDGYECLCLPGFAGTECQLDIDECASSPCKNGATCIDQPGNYSCQCVAPFKGVNCEFLPCEANNPCENGAECVEEPDHALFPLGFRCQCVPGFAGPRCEVNVDECSSNPCHHGFCYDVVGGYYCLCNPGYAGVRCEQDIDDCVNNMCENNSTCEDLHLSYQCLCQPGWEGEFCQYETDECASWPCKNNGSCLDLHNNYTCTCSPGWSGRDCAEDVNECDSGPCMNGARCVESATPGEFSCICAPFFTGTLCQQPFDPCNAHHDPCLNNSTCETDANGMVTCRCSPGFEGTHCEIDTNECISSPCQHQGYCLDRVNSYSCECKVGFSGRHCEEDINECASNPCQNGGICQDLVNRFRCNCPPGYFGALCDLDVNECEVSPCLHEGLCINMPGGFKCVCLPGFSGVWCELNIDECSSDPCRNGGKCIDGPNQYRCMCSPGFMGVSCETNIDECASSPCLHGSCIDEVDGYSCQCELGWADQRCETNINECESSPCFNGASCVDLINKYACFCLDGFTGKHCEVDVDVCLEAPQNISLCFNGGTCLDGLGSNFTCSCPTGFFGDHCELEINECCSEPCLHGAICQDLINGYRCHCRPGWTGLHCEDDINECLPQPCSQGMCIQNDPGHGYTCFCHPGFVGKKCEHNYDDCLLQPCPYAYECVDGINNVSCVPTATSNHTLHAMTPIPQSPLNPTPMPQSTALPDKSLQNTDQPTDFSYVSYSGDSYMEFEGISLGVTSNFSIRFQSKESEGTILYVDQGPVTNGYFFIKLFIQQGMLQYEFTCNQEEGIRKIDTMIQVDNGEEYMVYIRQHLDPCEAEVTVSGYKRVRSMLSNYWSGLTFQKTGHLFIGGLPLGYPSYQGNQPFYNYTGCIEIMEINKLRGFYTSNAIGGSNVDNCRSQCFHGKRLSSSTHNQWVFTNTRAVGGMYTPTMAPTPALAQPADSCHDEPCQNGGTCRPLQLPSGAASFQCDCPLHFTGPLCQKDTTVFFPSFNGMSYLELPSLTSLLEYDGDADVPFFPEAEDVVTLYLTVKSNASQGTILYTQEHNFGDRFLHVFLEDRRPVVKLGCSGTHVLTVEAGQNISNDRLIPITIRYFLSVGEEGGNCGIEIAVDDGTVNQKVEYLFHPMSKVGFGPLFLGGVPSHSELHYSAGQVTGLSGCIRELQVNTRELFIVDEAVRGRNIQNCNTPVCQHHPCRNGGSCISDAENWFCRCPRLYSGKLCQFSACERSPCGHGGTCIPKSPQDAVCLCPYGRGGILCDDPINITHPRFNGTDEFGYTSFMAYSSLPGISFFYEFKMKLTFSNNGSALRDNLILFSGQRGQGINGDDFLVLGVRSGRIVHKFNLGSGVGTVVSDRLDLGIGIHTIQFGRSFKTGWLKVDDQKNKTGSSPGHLVGLNVFSRFYVGGYNEYTPELLPMGARFQNGFQGCIFDLLFRTRRDGKFWAPGTPEGQPISGRSVGQCGDSPCALVQCQNGGTCVDSGSTVYCRCPLGWKGALCSETVSVCDAEHSPPPSCARGSTCVPLPEGYTCQCPLGTAGQHCQQALAISDPSFNGSRSSWMSFTAVGLRHRTDLQLQFQTLSPEGIMFYTAQRLSVPAGDFLCVSLTSGFVQLRYNLGDGTVVLQSASKVDTSGKTWHTVRAGRNGNEGYLVLDGQEVQRNSTKTMTTLDAATDVFVGGVSTLDTVSSCAVEKDPAGFTGCIRQVVLNGHELELTEGGASGGTNVGDWDGTACGYNVCQHNGSCNPVGSDGFSCVCPSVWTGPTCNQSVYCVKNLCQHGSLCVPDIVSNSYSCMCPLGWEGKYCNREISMRTARFMGNSYIKYKDPKYHMRNLRYTKVSFNFTSSTSEGLILWMGKAEEEDNDHLAIGLYDGHLRVTINLGERVSLPLTHKMTTLCCDKWHFLSITHNRTLIQVFVNEERVFFEDVDPFEHYVAINYAGVFYFGGFELHRDVATVTAGLFTQGFVGKIKDVFLYEDPKKINFLQNSEGFNVHTGDE
ncbi:protein eyes shut homolog [Megalops cyprinoides]|uniref:protein eyes shut homolog n=1 Tax=Megalops cyprinoides TaxID=118141 RepID=UPI0018655D4D|nr:protein eyes shut homolog [Megalops cyprinoides]